MISDSATRFAVPFARPSYDLEEVVREIRRALESDHHAGNGGFTQRCHALLGRMVPGAFPLVTHSGTAALEMAAMLIELGPGDEVILPSWTFASTANAVALRGAVPVFVDVRQQTLNISPAAVEAAINDRTRAVICVHYAGVACEMDVLQRLCRDRGLVLVEDAAQAVGACWNGQPLGGMGALGAFSFHASKNVSSGEGGALLVNEAHLRSRAEMIWEKGTDRAGFSRGEVARYTWRTLGSSYLPSELVAAFMAHALSHCEHETRERQRVWAGYDSRLKVSERVREALQLPEPPSNAEHNGHIYWVRTRTPPARDRLIGAMKRHGIEVLTHYEPLHLAPAGRRYCRTSGSLAVTEDAGRTLMRLPLHAHVTDADLDQVADALERSLA